ncbi:MAG: cytochrome c4 [Pseudomonadota bacterium]
MSNERKHAPARGAVYARCTRRALAFPATCLLLVALVASSAQCAMAAELSAPPDTMAQRVAACMVCHGKEGRAGNDGYHPRIAGKPEGYLYNQLVNFREGRRHNAAMAYLIGNLPDTYLREIAAYFAALHLPYPPPQSVAVPPATLAHGRELITQGDQSRDIPPCVACHGKTLTGTQPAIPGLIGLPRVYLYAQLSSWKNGSRHAAAPDCMAKIAGRLNWEDVDAVTAYLASQPVPADSAPAASNPVKPPLECGSVPAREGKP